MEFRVFKFKHKATNTLAYILAANEDMALLRLKQFTEKECILISSIALSKMDRLKSFILWNNIEPFKDDTSK